MLRQGADWAHRLEPGGDGMPVVSSSLSEVREGRRRVSTDSLARLAGVRGGGRRVVVHARVSSIKQKRDDNLERQRDHLLWPDPAERPSGKQPSP